MYTQNLPFLGIIKCPDLDDPKYGTVRVSGTTPGSRADYKCNAGFQLVGVAWRKCQANGQWTGQAPTCKRKHKNYFKRIVVKKS